MSLGQVKFGKNFDSPRLQRKQHVGIDSGVESIPSNVSSQKFTCPVTCNHLSVKDRERHIQKTRTHYKTSQGPSERVHLLPPSTETTHITKVKSRDDQCQAK